MAHVMQWQAKGLTRHLLGSKIAQEYLRAGRLTISR